MQPTQEQIERFWEWCGATRYDLWSFKGQGFKFPNGDKHSNMPLVDLNNLFKYAMPTIYEHNLWLELEKTGITNLFWCVDINPAIELFWAIWEVAQR